MSGLDENIKNQFIKWFETIMADSKKMEAEARERLIETGIEPNLDTVLAFLAGVCMGSAHMHSQEKYGDARRQDIQGVWRLWCERAWIMREAMLRTRIGG